MREYGHVGEYVQVEKEEGPSNTRSKGLTDVGTQPLSYKPSPSNGLNCKVMLNTIVGGLFIGGQ